MKSLITILFVVPFMLLSRAQGLSESKVYPVEPMIFQAGVVFTDNTKTTIYLATGSGSRVLHTSPGAGQYYGISPDKSTIYYKLINPAGSQTAAYYNLLTGKAGTLSVPGPLAGQASVADDGTLAVSSAEGIKILSGQTESFFETDVFSNLTPISRDGKYVVYNDKNDQLFLLHRETGARTMFTDGAIGYFNPQWNSTSDKILFSSLNGRIYIYDFKLKGSYYAAEGYNPRWSNSGEFIIYEKRELQNGIYGNPDLYLYEIKSANEYQLTDTPLLSEMTPSFSSDGGILYVIRENAEIISAELLDNGITNIQTVYKAGDDFGQILTPALSPVNVTEAMNIPYVHQVYDTPDWYNGHWACGPTTAIMLIAYWNLLPPYEGWCSWPAPGHFNLWGRYITDRYRFRQIDYQSTANDPNGTPSMGGFGFMWNGSYSPHSRMATYYGNHGIAATTDDSPTFAKAEAQLLAGNPYSICNGLTTAGHIVLAHGVNSQNRSVTVNDPYGNKNTPGYPSYDGKNAVYDWPGYNNGYQNFNTVYWCVNTAYTVPAHGDTIIDDLDYSKGFYLHNRLGRICCIIKI